MNTFTVKGAELKAKIVIPENPKEKNPGILFIHGLTGKMKNSYQYADGLAKLGYMSFLFDLRGHGDSKGDLSILNLEDFLEDATTAYDRFQSVEAVDKDNISLVGSSMGSYLAARLSAKRATKNIALRAPANYPDDVCDKPTIENGGDNPIIMEWRKLRLSPVGSLSLKALNRFDGEVLIMESENDDTVPQETVKNYADAVRDKSRLTYTILKGAQHSIKPGIFRDNVEKILVDWFRDRINIDDPACIPDFKP